MSRNLVLATLVVILCGTLACLAGLVPGASRARGPGAARERAAWWRLWAPLTPAAIVLALLVGWALQEPSVTDEILTPWALALATPLVFVWGRALIRAVAALRAPRGHLPAVVVGLLRPRVIIDPVFGQTLDADALTAVFEHEHAHVRHYDPLSIWLAQIATDLQWPSRLAPARLTDWLDALEDARDDEARRAGVRGEDLADAIVRAARAVRSPSLPRAAATLGARAIRLAERVDRLLRPLDREARLGHTRVAIATSALALAVVFAALLGWTNGDDVLRALPFVRS